MKAILTYHSVDETGSVISVDERTFRRHVQWLASGRVRAVPLDALASLPDDVDAVAITFDDGLESFGRIAAPFAHRMVIQSAKLAAVYPKAKVFDPLRMLDTPAPPKKPLLFATVGATLPFDRLVDMVAHAKREGVIPERVMIQTGVGGASPPGLEVVESLGFDQVQALLRDASIVVCHGGTGSLITALREGCHVIAVPRLSSRAEHYDDHQSEIVEAFVERKLVLKAETPDELRAALAQCRARDRVMATSDPQALVSFLKEVVALPAARRKAPT